MANGNGVEYYQKSRGHGGKEVIISVGKLDEYGYDGKVLVESEEGTK